MILKNYFWVTTSNAQISLIVRFRAPYVVLKGKLGQLYAKQDPTHSTISIAPEKKVNFDRKRVLKKTGGSIMNFCILALKY